MAWIVKAAKAMLQEKSQETQLFNVGCKQLKGFVQQARQWLFRPNFFSLSKWAQFWHVAFHFREKHTPLFKFAGFSFIFQK